MRVKSLLAALLCLFLYSIAYAQPLPAANPGEPRWDGKYRHLHVPILMYHYVSDLPVNADATRIGLTVTPAHFRAHMAYLVSHGYTTISLAQLDNALLTGALLPPKPIILTFDDGYVDTYLNVFPVLRQDGFTATFFVITGTADANNPGYLSWDQIRAMSNAGMDMEPHTVTHVNLRGKTRAFIVKQVQGSIQALALHTGKTPHEFAYPDGQYDGTVLAVMKASSVWVAVTTRGSDIETPDDRLELPRLRVDYRMGVPGLKELLNSN